MHVRVHIVRARSVTHGGISLQSRLLGTLHALLNVQWGLIELARLI